MPTHKDMAWSPPKRSDQFRQKVHGAPATWILIALNTIVYLVGLFPKYNFFSAGALSLSAVLAGQWYRLFTSMFLHLNWYHLLCNMWTLYSIGTALEHRLPRGKYITLYLLSGLSGSMGVIAWDWLRHTTELTVGASGAIFGLFGVLLAMSLKKRNSGVQTKTLVLDIILMLVPGFINTGISVSAHIGGLLGGLLFGLILV